MRAFLGLGSNIGDRRRALRTAVGAIGDVVAVSPLFETDPVGGPEQDLYYNIVVELDTRARPRQLLELCRRLEADAARRRTVRWGPRTLDVDVLLIPGTRVNEPDLEVPHPRMHQRNFVVQPLWAIDPTVEVPGYVAAEAYGDVRPVGPL
ncbi:MAG: 2-amino-4-hydroxy-6-hydroxymethyldihydropteridine diphosphokinase [Acidimicrobiia bacterium]|nr:2-amino-4-hydroxy-6-hydroxymethyldihydropteridine diphosphokinase [Acidimicrobiia bacterium]MDH4362974.1 2-amino-4-hydroxy-6-hydroxymethyldihydropteridine diphosphokinase [Acidimicrobiia bacterium]MDH5290387.1 2-amino-4-hydroxy-6-hydroxymethyldihydropteridine diphosphokinase [Acidimicrobiia bacterium]